LAGLQFRLSISVCCTVGAAECCCELQAVPGPVDSVVKLFLRGTHAGAGNKGLGGLIMSLFFVSRWLVGRALPQSLGLLGACSGAAACIDHGTTGFCAVWSELRATEHLFRALRNQWRRNGAVWPSLLVELRLHLPDVPSFYCLAVFRNTRCRLNMLVPFDLVICCVDAGCLL